MKIKITKKSFQTAKAIARDLSLFRGPICEYPPLFLWNKLKYSDILKGWEMLLNKSSNSDILLFVNSPFCKSKCKYCDYCALHYYSKEELKKYLKSISFITNELSFLKNRIKIFYISGGDLNAVPQWYLEQLYYILDKQFNVNNCLEKYIGITHSIPNISLLKFIKRGGFQKAVFQIQSLNKNFSTNELRRPLTYYSLQKTIDLLTKYGIKKIKFEWIVGIPGQTLNDIKKEFYFLRKMDPSEIVIVPHRKAFYNFIDNFRYKNIQPKLDVNVNFKEQVYYNLLLKTAKKLLENYPQKQSISFENFSVLGIGYGALSHIFGILQYTILDVYLNQNNKKNINNIYGTYMNFYRELRRYAILNFFESGNLEKEKIVNIFGQNALDIISNILKPFEEKGLISETNNNWSISKKSMLNNIIFSAMLYEKSIKDKFNKIKSKRKKYYKNLEKDLLKLYYFYE
jgi:oxygen-independent coproporphyrinogen-3 oxidase